ncbi:MAG TPA: hypothetical protein VL976_16980 [Xanthobacteraceae bacterium]|nr:hypothetical protein [Xanthobacteraceae bacterium]
MRIVHQAKTATVVGRDRLRLAAHEPHQRQACGDRERIPRRDIKARHGHADDPLHADQREARCQLAPQIERHYRIAFDGAVDLLDHRGNGRRRAAQVAKQIGAAGDAFLGEKIEQQQRRRGDALAAGAERIGHRHLDGGRLQGADGEARRRGAHCPGAVASPPCPSACRISTS